MFDELSMVEMVGVMVDSILVRNTTTAAVVEILSVVVIELTRDLKLGDFQTAVLKASAGRTVHLHHVHHVQVMNSSALVLFDAIFVESVEAMTQVVQREHEQLSVLHELYLLVLVEWHAELVELRSKFRRAEVVVQLDSGPLDDHEVVDVVSCTLAVVLRVLKLILVNHCRCYSTVRQQVTC